MIASLRSPGPGRVGHAARPIAAEVAAARGRFAEAKAVGKQVCSASMEVVSLSPLPVASLLWQPRPGAWMFTFACKATYDLRPGESPLASDQEPIYESECHWSNDPTWSLYAPRDVVPIRPRADVVLVGHAFAPGNTPVRSIVARLLVADIDKSIEVFCNRSFTQEGALQEGPRFTKMPLLYERAGGGPDTSNPVGLRPDARDIYGKRELPNLQPPGLLVTSVSDIIEPIGFGPIAATWSSRRTKLGRHAAMWSETSFHREPLPQDIDASYFNAAPRDQQTATLRDNERIVLDHLHADVPHLVTNLSGHHPRVFVERHGQPPQGASMRPDVLWIHTDRGLCTMMWRGQIPLEHAREAGVVRIALEGPGQVLSWEEVERLASQSSRRTAGVQVAGVAETLAPATLEDDAPESSSTGTISAPMVPSPSAPVLPFVPASSSNPAAPPPSSHGAPRLDGTPFVAAAPLRRRESSAEWPAAVAPSSAPRSAPMSAPFTAGVQPPVAAPPFVATPPPVAAPPLVMAPPPIAAQPLVAPPPLVVRAPGAATPSPSAVASPWSSSGAVHSVGATPPTTIGTAAVQSESAMSTPVVHGGSGALGASNAAAAASAPWTLLRRDGTPAPTGAITPAAYADARPEGREILHLLWFDPESVPRIRRQPSWRTILDALDQKPMDKDLDDPALAKDPMEIEDRREVFEILAHAASTNAEGIQEALTEGVRDDGKYVPPLKLIAGELSFPFDELETLKATVTTVTPLVGSDEHLRATVLAAQDFLKIPELRSAPAVAEGLTNRIREAFTQGKRVVPQGYLDTQTERVLLEQRHYQRRAVFGRPHLRTLLQPAGSSQQIPMYLPDALAKELPMYQRFKTRVIAEVHLQVDQYESHPVALRGLALVRTSPQPGRR